MAKSHATDAKVKEEVTSVLSSLILILTESLAAVNTFPVFDESCPYYVDSVLQSNV